MGQTIHYEYNSDNRLKKVTYGTGEVIEYTSPEWINAGNGNEENSVAVQQSGLKIQRGQKSVEIVPAANGQIQTLRKNNGEEIQLQHDERNQISEFRSAQAGKTAQHYALKYDEAGRLTEQRNEANGQKTKTTYNDWGQKTYEKDPEGRETHWVYNEFGELEQEQYGKAKATHKSYEYYDNGAQRGLKKSQQENGAVTHYTYDAWGNLASETKGNTGEANHEQTSFERDGAGNVLKKTEGDNIRQTSYTYDAYNELLSVTEARGTSNFSYEQFRRKKILTDPLGRQFILELNDQDLLTQKTLPNGLSWGFTYNDERQLTEKTTPNDEKITYSYGSKGKFRKETLPDGMVNQKKYTESDALLWAKNKYLRFTTIFDENGFNQGFDYVFNGQAPIQIRFTTDKTGKKQSISAKRPVNKVKVYDENNKQITSKVDLNNPDDIVVEKNAEGKVTKMTKGALSNEFVYDAEGNLTDVVQKGRVEEIASTELLLQKMNYAYNDQGQLVSITGGDFGVNFEYQDNGQLKAVVRHNHTRTEYGFHASGKTANITEHTTRPNEATVPISTQAYAYNSAGDCTSWQKNQQTWALSYDADDQLIEASTTGQNYRYAYDQVGNRVQYNQEVLEYDAQSLQCTSNGEWQFAYDADGNLTTKTNKSNPAIQQHFSYNALGQLVAFSAEDGGATPTIEATYTYGGAGRRIGKQVSYRDTPDRSYTRWYIYDQDNILLELDEHFQPVRQYIHALATDTIIGFIENKQVYYLSKDAFGNVVGILDAAGEWVTRYAYDPFGMPVASNDDSAIQVPFRFASREWDEESQTYFFRNRQYDPTLGRFLQPDPHPGNPEDPMSIFCPYAYARNNPLKYADPYGLFWFLVALLALAKAVIVTAVISIIAGLIGGIISQIRGDGFRSGFREGFLFGVRFIAYIGRITTLPFAALLGATSSLIVGISRGISYTFRGLNFWEGFREGVDLGWEMGFGSGLYFTNRITDVVMALFNKILPGEYDLEAYDERIASFLTYSCLMADRNSFPNNNNVQLRLPQGFQVHNIIDTENIDDPRMTNTHTRVYTAFDTNFDSTLVVFTETDSGQDWIENFVGQLIARINWPQAFSFESFSNPQVGLGFWRDYESVRERLFTDLRQIDATTGNDNPIFVTGFSLGGAQAVIAGLDIAQNFNREVHVYSVAGPKVGNPDFVDLFRSEVTSTHKLMTEGDFLPRLPLGVQGYAHAPLVRFFDEPGNGLDLIKVFDLHDLRVYLNNILQQAMGENTIFDVDFTSAVTRNYLAQANPHAFDFMPINLGALALLDIVRDLINNPRLFPRIINATASKNNPVLR